FASRRRHTSSLRDWSSDVCSSDLVVIVTGAGAGVGRGVCLACAKEGASVVVTSRYANGKDVTAEINDAGGKAVWSRCDVTVRARSEERRVGKECRARG